MTTHRIAHWLGALFSVFAAAAVAYHGYEASGVITAGFNAIVALAAIWLLPMAISTGQRNWAGGLFVAVFWFALAGIQITQTFDVIATRKADAAKETERRQGAHDRAEDALAVALAQRAAITYQATTAEDVEAAEASANRAQQAAQRAGQATADAKSAADTECADGLGPRCAKRREAEDSARAAAAQAWTEAGEFEAAVIAVRAQKGRTDQARIADAAVADAKATLDANPAPNTADAQSASIAASLGVDQATVSTVMDFLKSFGVELAAIAFLVVAALTAPSKAEIEKAKRDRAKREAEEIDPPTGAGAKPTRAKKQADARAAKAKAKKKEAGDKALAAVISGVLTTHAAAKEHGVSESTLRGRVKRFQDQHADSNKVKPLFSVK